MKHCEGRRGVVRVEGRMVGGGVGGHHPEDGGSGRERADDHHLRGELAEVVGGEHQRDGADELQALLGDRLRREEAVHVIDAVQQHLYGQTKRIVSFRGLWWKGHGLSVGSEVLGLSS